MIMGDKIHVLCLVAYMNKIDLHDDPEVPIYTGVMHRLIPLSLSLSLSLSLWLVCGRSTCH